MASSPVIRASYVHVLQGSKSRVFPPPEAAGGVGVGGPRMSVNILACRRWVPTVADLGRGAGACSGTSRRRCCRMAVPVCVRVEPVLAGGTAAAC